MHAFPTRLHFRAMAYNVFFSSPRIALKNPRGHSLKLPALNAPLGSTHKEVPAPSQKFQCICFLGLFTNQ